MTYVALKASLFGPSQFASGWGRGVLGRGEWSRVVSGRPHLHIASISADFRGIQRIYQNTPNFFFFFFTRSFPLRIEIDLLVDRTKDNLQTSSLQPETAESVPSARVKHCLTYSLNYPNATRVTIQHSASGARSFEVKLERQYCFHIQR